MSRRACEGVKILEKQETEPVGVRLDQYRKKKKANCAFLPHLILKKKTHMHTLPFKFSLKYTLNSAANINHSALFLSFPLNHPAFRAFFMGDSRGKNARSM